MQKTRLFDELLSNMITAGVSLTTLLSLFQLPPFTTSDSSMFYGGQIAVVHKHFYWYEQTSFTSYTTHHEYKKHYKKHDFIMKPGKPLFEN